MIFFVAITVAACSDEFLDRPWTWELSTPEQMYYTFPVWQSCATSPASPSDRCGCIGRFDFDSDCDVDLMDFAEFQRRVGDAKQARQTGDDVDSGGNVNDGVR